MNQATVQTRFPLPQLNKGETYAGAIINPDGTGNHTILLPGDNDDADWQTQMDWAKSIGGTLPDRVQQAMLYKHLPEHFQKDWYWSCEKRSAGSAWYQTFLSGGQDWSNTSSKCRAVAVRSVAI
ncbi:hypothetical protein [Sideroxydans lithotrophicus]|uniref:DUF1566 domain-containing protein n=1 Tax=Sideroxydans lithotrophicus (strain ES-1) TaxID=580332 RepID=D5CUA7_SIDLE|nr:hypothetical protein [Sideroxydans lithotrophicus]ADE10442.1 conserved hypothetical protein [Sideroxydans lithotrophicus ES-1]